MISQQHVAESIYDETYDNVVLSSLSVILSVSELIWASTETYLDFFVFFLMWDDAFVFDEKSRIFRAITVPATER